MSDDDPTLRERIGDAVDHLGDKIRGHDDDIDPDVDVHLLDEREVRADRVQEDER